MRFICELGLIYNFEQTRDYLEKLRILLAHLGPAT